MSSIPNILTNKFVLTGIGKSSFRDSSLIKPIFGAAGRMGKIASEAPALTANPTLKGTFKADLNATNAWGPKNLGNKVESQLQETQNNALKPLSEIMPSSTNTHKILVVGSTGATGKHVVQMLLDRGDTEVVAIARSQDKLMGLLQNSKRRSIKNLTVKEAGIGNMTVDELKTLTEGCTAVVSCLGHNLTFKGMFREGLFVSETVKKLTASMPKGCRFVMMGTDAVAYPDGSDPKRTRFERGILRLMRWLLPPVKDNELSAEHLFKAAKANPDCYEWVAVRPGDLLEIEEEAGCPVQNDYIIYEHTFGGLFGDNDIARSQVGHFLAELAIMDSGAFQKSYNHKMPVIYQKKAAADINIGSDETLISTHE